MKNECFLLVTNKNYVLILIFPPPYLRSCSPDHHVFLTLFDHSNGNYTVASQASKQHPATVQFTSVASLNRLFRGDKERNWFLAIRHDKSTDDGATTRDTDLQSQAHNDTGTGIRQT